MVDKRHAWAAVAERRSTVWGAVPYRPSMGIVVSHSALAVETISDLQEFERLGSEWSELLSASGCPGPFLSWEWQFSWWKHLAGGRRLHLLAVRRGDVLLGVAPLALRPPQPRRLLPFSALEFMGTGMAGSDYLDLILRDGAEDMAVSALAAHLAKEKHTLELAQVSAASSHVSRLATRLGEFGWQQLRETPDVCPYVDLRGHRWETYLDSLSSAHRYNFRRRLRNLHKRYDLSFVQARDETERRDMLQTLVTLHQRRWNGLSLPGAFGTPDLVRFHDEWSRLALQRGWLRLYLLRLDGVPAAALYGFRSGDVFYFYQSGFDPAYAKSSVGMIVLGLAIKSALEEGVHECDLLHGDESYKFKWTTATRELARFTLCPPTGRGMLYRQAVRARQGMKKMMSGLGKRVEGR